jgi:hypothetical protein
MKDKVIKRHRRFGDRYDGRRIYSLPPMQYITPFVMKERNDATNYFRGRVDMSYIDDYISKKARDEKLIGFSFMHVVIAAYIRVLSEYPGLNRFISGQRIYKRNDIVLSLMVKKGYKLNSQETAIKPVFGPADTIYDVYHKFTAEIEKAKKEGDSTNLDNAARIIARLPALFLRCFVSLMSLLDYFGHMPKVIHRASPFHASIFLSNLGSIGIQPVYHHLYNFGNVPIFITFGSVYRSPEISEIGSVIKKKYIDYTVVTDERITDGQYYAAAIKQFNRLMHHPLELDIPPAAITEDIK